MEWDGTKSCTGATVIEMHKGHMIAAAYGQGHGGAPGVRATFTYTNAVPQMGSFNSGAWKEGEKKVIEFAKLCDKNAIANKKTGLTYVVVGVVPSHYLGKPKYFGAPGFSEIQDATHSIVFPEIMWTAACCVQSDDTVTGTMAFYGRNIPKKGIPVVEAKNASTMFTQIKQLIYKEWKVTFVPPKVFPNKPLCETFTVY